MQHRVDREAAGAALADIVIGHYEALIGLYGERVGVRAARKHLAWYMERVGAPGDGLKRAILTESRPDAVMTMMRALIDPDPERRAA